MAAFGDKAFKEVIEIKFSHENGALIQYEWCPH